MTDETLSEKRRRAAMARKTFAGGKGKGGDMGGRRPRDPVRCPCGANALSRARSRGVPDGEGLFACCRRRRAAGG